MWYACVGALSTGARCRQEAVENGFCKECARENRLRAPEPTHVIFKFFVSPQRGQALGDDGVLRVKPEWGARDRDHFTEALVHGEEPHVQGRIIGSGVPVFGEKGLSEIRLFDLWQELLGLGFALQDVHLESHRNKNKDSLVMSVARAEAMPFPSSRVQEQVESLLGAVWRFTHVWANPPKENSTVPHSVICTSMLQGQKTHQVLKFQAGLWGV